MISQLLILTIMSNFMTLIMWTHEKVSRWLRFLFVNCQWRAGERLREAEKKPAKYTRLTQTWNWKPKSTFSSIVSSSPAAEFNLARMSTCIYHVGATHFLLNVTSNPQTKNTTNAGNGTKKRGGGCYYCTWAAAIHVHGLSHGCSWVLSVPQQDPTAVMQLPCIKSRLPCSLRTETKTHVLHVQVSAKSRTSASGLQLTFIFIMD